MKGDEPAMKYQKVLIFIARSSLFICDLYDQGFEHQRNTAYINNRFEISF